MKSEKKFYRCQLCGNLVGMIEEGAGTLVCCGKDMEMLTPNSRDAAQEKHVPVAKRENNKLVVTVGSNLHPMTEEHHIAWIAVSQGDRMQRAELDKTGEPGADFMIGDGPITVYAYCNLHGLWSAEIN